ncbi:MAG: bifunctional (p)ppGpp synthetase/guanosine-3',5'-bis(diphosphate) 3'-pyrophosphohydrolase [Bryobacterales bacterium]|nr:bifunctional (p)ppGpp synthetase/guanosine-3',5'-bis(diphosphate) 3'-pyrophosphohydrolase [Bryobacterales bacterium]
MSSEQLRALHPIAQSEYQALEDLIRASRPWEDFEILRKTFDFANYYHYKQKRHTGEPYILHPLDVAKILFEMQMDLMSIQSGMLHDVLEDTEADLPEVIQYFGEHIGRVVDGVTKIGKLDFGSKEERQAESMRKMLLAMVNDIRVIIVKLADRLHNMRTLAALSRDKQERIASETVEIYAPIANRLGMGKVRGELEDIALSFLEPDSYAEVAELIEMRRQANEESLVEIQKEIESNLESEQIPARVVGRIKRPFSVYQKLKRQKISVEEVYDLLALRIITDSVKNCYAALGIIHNMWRPIPGRIKDFIAIPRPNLYQSLHTSVIGPRGQAFEVQIRTEEMHRLAEEGIAAHWKYKEGKLGAGLDDARIAWLRQLVEWQREMRDPGEFLATLKVDLYPEAVYSFTPKGRVVALPRGATPVDFAYAIHTEVGHRCVGAKVNGRIVPLRYTLKNGEVVEILTQPGHQPSKDWLGIVQTARARNKIKAVINANERVKAIEIGQKTLEKEARRLSIALNRFSKADLMAAASDYGYSKHEDLLAGLGYGRLSPRKLLEKLSGNALPDAPPEPREKLDLPEYPQPNRDVPKGDLTIKVRGIDDILVYRAGCCNPIPGEPIVGYITRGKGVAVHSVNCRNVQSLLYEVERKIDVEWDGAARSFPVRLCIFTDDRPGILNKLTSILSEEESNIRSLEARADSSRDIDGALVEMTVDIRDKKQLERITMGIRRISGVRDIERIYERN